jgi:hypothetical protein
VPGAGDTITVTVRRSATGRNKWGDQDVTVVEHTIDGCLFAPGPSQEIGFQANTERTDGTIYAPPAVDVRSTDLVVVRGKVYGVVGEPQDWGSSGTVIVLRAWTG